MPVWKSAGRMVAYDASASGRTLLRRYDADVAIGRKSATYDDNAARPVTAHPYDHSAAIRPQNTMAVRSDVQKPYDANLMKSTMSKKFVTPSATSPATPLTSAFKSSACPSTTPCARSPEPDPKTSATSGRWRHPIMTPVRPKPAPAPKTPDYAARVVKNGSPVRPGKIPRPITTL